MIPAGLLLQISPPASGAAAPGTPAEAASAPLGGLFDQLIAPQATAGALPAAVLLPEGEAGIEFPDDLFVAEGLLLPLATTELSPADAALAVDPLLAETSLSPEPELAEPAGFGLALPLALPELPVAVAVQAALAGPAARGETAAGSVVAALENFTPAPAGGAADLRKPAASAAGPLTAPPAAGPLPEPAGDSLSLQPAGFEAELEFRADSSSASATAATPRGEASEAPRSPLLRNVFERLEELEHAEGRTRILLRPQGLGILEIDVSRLADGRLQMAIRAENPLILQSLQQEAGALSDFLGDRGFDLAGGGPDLGRYARPEPQAQSERGTEAGAAGAAAPAEPEAPPARAATAGLRAGEVDIVT